MCTNVQGHATRCMLTDGEMEDVRCTSVRRLVRREKRVLHEEQKSGNSARLTLSRLDTVATQPGTARATAILGSAHPTRHSSRKGERKSRRKGFSACFRLVQGVLTCWDFRTPCVRTCLRQEIFPQRLSWSVRASLTLCVSLLRAISARARGTFGRWILDDPFPQFRSHGRINVTGSGNFRA